ncbi:MAG: hypothetical protein P1V35_10790 [Planctomycetota bacterium]|nr:hypothetical protein [Planctomycetota bacterium]
MKAHAITIASALVLAPTFALATPVQDSMEQRMKALELRNQELTQYIEALSTQMEQVQFPDTMPAMGDSVLGMGPAASKVYGKNEGFTFGGYGEAIFTDYSGSKGSTSDYLRNVIYAGYKFEHNWVFNSEIEFEHASTGQSGSASVEFAYLEYQKSEAMNFRAGLLLAPLGFVNEMHEPTTYFGASRPETERRIIPSTWRENGLGILGDTGGFQYKAYVMTGLDAAGFSEAGLRGGRQKGSKSKSEDLALALRLDWTENPGALVGISAYVGEADQDGAGLGSVGMTIFDLHAQYQVDAWRFRGLVTTATVDNTEEIFIASGADATVVGERQDGFYLEAGYDFFHNRESKKNDSLTAFVRYEELDTHASVDSALTADPTQEEEILTVGLQWAPITNIVFKVDYQDFDQAEDRLNLSMGYAF